ncbi:hypothetical protein ACEUZ9_001139 [Paracoccus litorisediminis]|uniref:hypothetical protein n=1 Tax=Paracoccus litorisediminis TaxID=2006130 RepID=UPI00372DB8B0
MPNIPEDLFLRVLSRVDTGLRAELSACMPGNGRSGTLIEVPFRYASHYASALGVGATVAWMNREGKDVAARMKSDADRCRDLLPAVFSRLLHRGDAGDILVMMHEGQVRFKKESSWSESCDFTITGSDRSKLIFIKRGEKTDEIIAELAGLAAEICQAQEAPSLEGAPEP